MGKLTLHTIRIGRCWHEPQGGQWCTPKCSYQVGHQYVCILWYFWGRTKVGIMEAWVWSLKLGLSQPGSCTAKLKKVERCWLKRKSQQKETYAEEDSQEDCCCKNQKRDVKVVYDRAYVEGLPRFAFCLCLFKWHTTQVSISLSI